MIQKYNKYHIASDDEDIIINEVVVSSAVQLCLPPELGVTYNVNEIAIDGPCAIFIDAAPQFTQHFNNPTWGDIVQFVVGYNLITGDHDHMFIESLDLVPWVDASEYDMYSITLGS